MAAAFIGLLSGTKIAKKMLIMSIFFIFPLKVLHICNILYPRGEGNELSVSALRTGMPFPTAFQPTHFCNLVATLLRPVAAICDHDGIELRIKDLNAIIVKIHELFRYRSDHVLFYANFMRTKYGYGSSEVCNEF